MSEQNFARKGNDIITTVTISCIQAMTGCKMPVKALTRSIMLTVPPGTQPGTKMRLKGLGLSVNKQVGDMFVEIKIEIPQNLTDHQKQLLQGWEK